ncbi:siderophore ABC transporter substrate-binding protein [Rossellomorea sp. BNER]|uniref:siderophore ABC transporter substrate-binding protein n=1 Tax=Rossellomorea sp. BNER TaxID=2962031 RepID=UPI003AF2A9E3|nr:siderophore ABC transporter substrate-binding protein [Rossellomorea sp. BNER]
MKKISFIILTALTLLLSACGTSDKTSGNEGNKEAEELTIKHELGETKVKENPEKVVVFDFGILDSMDKLGIEVEGLPQASVPSYLSKYEDSKYKNTGSLKEPDFEKISEIQPDLIIISGRQSDLYEEFTEIAPTIYLGVDTSRYMESFKENTKTLGEIFNKEKEVEKELAAIDDSIQKLKNNTKKEGKKALIVLANDDKVSAYGAGSRFGIIHDVFGFTPADEKIEVSTHGQSISFEYIVDKNPDYLFVIDRGAAIGEKSSAKQVVENELVKTTNAYKNNAITYLDPDYWYLSGGGLVSVSEMIKEVEASL